MWTWLLWAGCGDSVALPDGLAAPPGALELRVGPTTPGQPYTIDVRGARPRSTIYLASAVGLGPGPCLPLLEGLCLDLRAPTLLATLTADATGEAHTTAIAPPAGLLALQAASSSPTEARKSLPLLVNVPPLPACWTWTSDAGRTEHLAAPRAVYDPATDWPVERLRARRLTLSGGPSAVVDGFGVRLWDHAGTPIPLPLSVPSGAPLTEVWVTGEASAHGALTARGQGCADAAVTVDTSAVQLAGHSLMGPPHVSHARGFFADEAVEIGVDPTRHPDRVGHAFDLWVVAHRPDADWAADPTLVGVSPPLRGEVLGPDTVDDVWTSLAPPLPGPPALVTAFDVVLDFDQNGRLDPGDVRSGSDRAPAFSVLADPSTPLSRPTRRQDVSFGGLYQQGRVYYPQAWQAGELAPLVVISHGNGHDFRWYDYLGEHLASHGYVVFSHASNTQPGPVAASSSFRTNVERFLTEAPRLINGHLNGHLDGTMSWIGHSRGGEAVVIAWDDIVDGRWRPAGFTADAVRSVHSIAPTVFEGQGRASPHDMNYHLIAGGADGDVTGGADCDQCQYGRIAAYGTGRVLTTYLQGAGHNDFHDGNGWNDATGPDLLGKAAVHTIARGALLSALEWHHRGRTEYAELFARGQDIRPPSWGPTAVVARTWVPSPAEGIRILDDFQQYFGAGQSTAGAPVSWSASRVHEGLLNDGNANFAWSQNDPMNGMTEVAADGFERGVVLEWDGHAWMEWAMPNIGRDISGWDHLVLRVAQQTRHPLTDGLDAALGFGITLRDGQGRIATIRYGLSNPTTDPYERGGLGAGRGWANEFNTVRVPLADFTADGARLDLRDIAALRLEFGPFYGSPQGAIGLDDLMLVHEPTEVQP